MTGAAGPEVVALTTTRVAEILRRQFPEITTAEVSWLGAGYDSTAFDVDHEWVFRFPMRRDVEQQLLLELKVLPILAPLAPLRVPAFCFHGRPSEWFPFHFGGYPRIGGIPAILPGAATLRLDDVAPGIGRFLSWLHAFPPDEATRLGVPRVAIETVLRDARDESLAEFANLERAVAGGPPRAWRTFLEQGPQGGSDADPRPVVVHGDLAAEHVLYDPGAHAITGIIDWSEIAITDASADLAALFHWGGPRFADAVLAHYDGTVHALTLARARYLAACRGVLDVTFGLETGRPEYVDAGLRALAACAAPEAA